MVSMPIGCGDILNSVAGDMVVINRDGLILQTNQSWTQKHANPVDPSVQVGAGADYFEVCRFQGLRGRALRQAAVGIREVLGGVRPVFEQEYVSQRPDGRRWMLMRVSPLMVQQVDGIIGAVILHIDITERKTNELTLSRLAYIDPLTGLVNRRALLERLDKEFTSGSGERCSLLFIDVDHFKVINDELGHEAGDKALVAVADVLRASTRTDDLVARIGGDEFALVCAGLQKVDGTLIARRILSMMMGHPPVLLEQPHPISLSIGVATYPFHGRTATDLMRSADRAMYAQKHAGGGGYQVMDLLS